MMIMGLNDSYELHASDLDVATHLVYPCLTFHPPDILLLIIIGISNKKVSLVRYTTKYQSRFEFTCLDLSHYIVEKYSSIKKQGRIAKYFLLSLLCSISLLCIRTSSLTFSDVY